MLFKSYSSTNIQEEIIGGLENWCIVFNKTAQFLFVSLKFIFVFIMLSIGILTLLKLRGIHLQIRTKNVEAHEDRLKKPRLILGGSYIFIAIGILFNFLTYFLIWALNPLDPMIYSFINFNGDIDPHDMNRIKNIENAKYPHEKTIYYCIAYGSFFFVLNLLLSIWYLINNSRVISSPRKVITNLLASLIGAIVFGFTTFLPLFL